VQAKPDEHLRKKRTGYLFTLFPFHPDCIIHDGMRCPENAGIYDGEYMTGLMTG
jgi:hypothetical protein